MKFLTRLSRLFVGSSERESGSGSGGRDTPLAPYIYSSGHFSKQNRIATEFAIRSSLAMP